MEINVLSVKQGLKVGSPAEEEKESTVSPVPTRRLTFGSPTEEEKESTVSPVPTRRLTFGSPAEEESTVSPVPTRMLTFGSPGEEHLAGQLTFGLDFGSSAVSAVESSSGEEFTMFVVNQETPPPPVPEKKKNEDDEDDLKLAVPLLDFIFSLENHMVLSPVVPIQPIKPSLEKKIAEGSSAEVFQMNQVNDKKTVRKVYLLGTNGNNRGTRKHIDNKDLLKMLSAFNRSRGNLQCARVDGITIFKNGDIWEMNVVQEECSALTDKDVRRYLRCIISLLQDFIPMGQGQFVPTDFKKVNFGVDGNGEVVWIDFDFKKHEFGNVPDVCSSGEFIFNGNEKFQRLLLSILDFFLEVKSERKEAFRALNDKKSLLQGLGLLDSDKSISETTLDDFREVLQKIELSEEDIAYLVGLLTPPASSQ
jgi:hypothetical protein